MQDNHGKVFMAGTPLSMGSGNQSSQRVCGYCSLRFRGHAHQHRYKGEAAVLDLLDLELSKHLWVISQAQRVERSTCTATQP